MKKKILWILLSFLLVAALVLSSCGEVVPGEQEEEEEEEEPVGEQEEEEEEEEEEVPVAGAPQYGGTLTGFFDWNKNECPSPDPAEGYFDGARILAIVQEKPLIGDMMYGPRGTNDWGFHIGGYIPPEYLTGSAVESWDVFPDKIVYHVRPEIHFAADNVDFMENRELTAEDVAFSLLLYRNGPAGAAVADFVGEVTATDRYTVVIELTKLNVDWMYLIGYHNYTTIIPHEVIANDPSVWENHVGSGPFMVKEYIVGSHFTYERNPNYWGTTVVNGKEYPYPFLDEMVAPIIPDRSTQMAALRSGVLDFGCKIMSPYWPTLDLVPSDELLSSKYLGKAEGYYLNTSIPPFDNKEVRRAMMIATDIEAVHTLWAAPGITKHLWPVNPEHPVYIPLEELPADIRILYDYNPDLAKQMLADEGYPDGFPVDMCIIARPMCEDLASLIKDQWSKVGVEVKIQSVQQAVHTQLLLSRTYGNLIFGTHNLGSPITELSNFTTGHPGNQPLYSNARFDDLMNRAMQEVDIDVRNPLVEEASLILMEDVVGLPIAPILEANYWWAWLKNYYGETYTGHAARFAPLQYAWIDQDLKAEMGY